VLGTPGLFKAYLGNVVLVNAPGTGVVDEAVYAYIPRSNMYLGEEMIIPNVQTYICDEEADRKYVIYLI
jgi:uncharacterized circularly permuted ATP-grasp superfamily protein